VSQPMRLPTVVVLCITAIFAKPLRSQTSLEPMHVSPGTVLTFHVQTRLHPGTGNDAGVLPSGTVLRVKILDSIDSAVDRDGSEFRGVVASSVVAGKVTVLHSDSEVRGIFALLRSRNHPEGFRYELLITGINDRGKNYDLTASLNSSFRETTEQSSATADTDIKGGGRKETVPASTKLAVPVSK